MENPFIKKVREGQFKMLFSVSEEEAEAIFSVGGGAGGEGYHLKYDGGVTGHRVTEIIVPSMPEGQYSDFISDRKATIESFLASCGSRAVGLEITIRSSDGAHITAKFD